MDSEDVSNSNLCAVGIMYGDDFFSEENLATTNEVGKKSLAWTCICEEEVDSGSTEIGQARGRKFEIYFYYLCHSNRGLLRLELGMEKKSNLPYICPDCVKQFYGETEPIATIAFRETIFKIEGCETILKIE